MFKTWYLFVVLTTPTGADIEHVSTLTDQKAGEQTAQAISRKGTGTEIQAFCVEVAR